MPPVEIVSIPDPGLGSRAIVLSSEELEAEIETGASPTPRALASVGEVSFFCTGLVTCLDPEHSL